MSESGKCCANGHCLVNMQVLKFYLIPSLFCYLYTSPSPCLSKPIQSLTIQIPENRSRLGSRTAQFYYASQFYLKKFLSSKNS